MDEAFFNLTWLIVIFIWLFLSLFKKKPLPLPKERPQAPEEKIEPQDLWETLGFPLPFPPEEPLQPKIIKPELKKIEVLAEPQAEKEPPIEKKEEPIPEKEEELLLSKDKLQEGIILSVILGPPKARKFYQSRRT